jgi:hypothetical protein
MTLQVVIGCILALHCARQRPWLGALGVVLGTLKPTFGLPLLLLMAVRKDFPALARGLALVLAGNALVLAALLVQGIGLDELASSFRANLAWHGEHPNTNLATTYSRVDSVFLLSRASGWIPGLPTQLAVALGCMAVGLWASVRATRADRGELSAVIGYLTLLLFFYHQSYDLLLLCLPAAALLSRRVSPWSGLSPRSRWLLLACFTLPLANFVATDTGRGLVDWHAGLWRAITLFNATAVALAFVACCVLAWRAPDEPGAEARA